MADIIVPGIFLVIMSIMAYKGLKTDSHSVVGLLSLGVSILLTIIIILMIWLNFIKG